MKLLRELNDISARGKAGIIPFTNVNGVITMLFMTASNAKFGGSDPMIAKGRIDGGETAAAAAVREGEEELGLKRSNFKGAPFIGWKGELTGLDETYTMTVYAVEVKDPADFDTPHYETDAVHWLTPEEFNQKGRKSQRAIVAAVVSKIR